MVYSVLRVRPMGIALRPFGLPKKKKKGGFRVLPLSDGYNILMSPKKDETAVHCCHCSGDMAVLHKVYIFY